MVGNGLMESPLQQLLESSVCGDFQGVQRYQTCVSKKLYLRPTFQAQIQLYRSIGAV